MPTHDFNPAPHVADEILTDLATDPHASIAALAAKHHTTVAALTLWITRPDIDDRLAVFDSLFARRARLIATAMLPQAITTLTAVMNAFDTDAPHAAPSTQHADPNATTDPRATALRLRAAETARRAATTIIRLSNFTPGPRRTPRRESAPCHRGRLCVLGAAHPPAHAQPHALNHTPAHAPIHAAYSTHTPHPAAPDVPRPASPASPNHRADTAPLLQLLTALASHHTPDQSAPRTPAHATPPRPSPAAPPTAQPQARPHTDPRPSPPALRPRAPAAASLRALAGASP